MADRLRNPRETFAVSRTELAVSSVLKLFAGWSQNLYLFATFVVCLTTTIGLSSANAIESPMRKSPNVLLIMTDDQGWGDVTSHENSHLKTPRLDALAASGARLQRFYVSPVCAPTRAGLLTGRYHLRTGTHGVTRGRENMRGSEDTLAELLGHVGYRTGCFGKWHNGAHWPHHPNGQGFDEFVGFCAGHWNNYFSTALEHNGKPIASDGFIADVFTDRAIDFMTRSDDAPFFCYVPYNTPHSPWQVPDSYWNRHVDADLPIEARCAYAMCENIDDNVGRLLDALKENGLEENTIVIFLTDNGPNSNRYNGDMKGRKGSVNEGGSRVPCFIRFPGVIKPGTEIDRITANLDLVPTLLQLCDVPTPAAIDGDGRDLTPLLTGQVAGEDWADRSLMVFQGRGEKGAIRTQKWRAVQGKPGVWTLYDMEVDPSETSNVAKQHPEVLKRLRGEYEAFLKEVDAGNMQPLPIQIGHDEWPTVKLPAHEAELTPTPPDGLSYVGRSGWANDWLTNWSSPDAFASWPIQVVEPGNYAVTVEYSLKSATPPPQIGLQAGSQTLTVTLHVAYEAEQIPSPDRITRKEVYERKWKTLKIGSLRLEDDATLLKIRALNANNNPNLEIKSIALTRLTGRSSE